MLDSKVLNNMKKKFPADHTRIRNKAVGYFQSQNQFEMGNFLEATLNDYVPIDNDFPKTLNFQLQKIKLQLEKLKVKLI